MPYGLKDIELEKLGEVFAANERIERVVLYGSRAKGNYKPFSDVDITLEGAELTHTDLNRISLAIDDLLLPYQFDISIFHTLKNEALIDHIRRMGITIYEKKSEWKEYKLGEIADILDYKRKPLSSMERSTRKGIYPYYGASGIIDSIDDYIFDGEHILISEDGENLRTRQTPIAFLANGKFWVNNHAHILKADYVHSRLICYYFAQLDLNPYITGAVQPKLSQDSLNRIPLFLPTSINEREKIVSILSSLDDKIDLLHRENATLEQMAEALFRQWFVVEAKEDWEEGTVADLVEFNPTRKLVKGTIAPFLEMSNLSTSTYAPTYWYNRAFSSGSKFQNGDTLLARITPCLENGKTAYVDFLNENQVGWGSTEFIVMHSKLGIHSFFSYVIAKYQDFRDYAESCMSGSSGRQRVDVDNLKNYPINIPDKTAIVQFNNEIETMVSKMNNNNKQIQTLIQMRDGLLERLMSGEIKI